MKEIGKDIRGWLLLYGLSSWKPVGVLRIYWYDIGMRITYTTVGLNEGVHVEIRIGF